MKPTRIKTILALAVTLALAGGYFAFAQRNYNGNGNGNFGRNQGNNTGDYGGGNFNRGQGGFGGGGGFGTRNNYGGSGYSQSTNVPGPTEYTRFSQYIADRNIFNPARFAPTAVAIQTARRPPAPSPTFGLVGTMAYEKGMFAFFDGNSAEYQMVLYASESNHIAGFIVADVTPAGVKLQTSDKAQSMDLKIGDSLQQQHGRHLESGRVVQFVLRLWRGWIWGRIRVGSVRSRFRFLAVRRSRLRDNRRAERGGSRQ